MPAYPCVQCSKQVDVRDLECRSCREKKPFKCSRCDKRLNSMEVFKADQLTFQKPLFCGECGLAGEAVSCPHCRSELVRRNGVDDNGVLYHQDCYKTVQIQKKIAPTLQIFLMLFLGYMSFSLMRDHGQKAAGVAVGMAFAVAGYFLGGLMAPRR